MHLAVILTPFILYPTTLMKPFVTVDRLYKDFYKNKRLSSALKDVSFSVNKGEIFGIIGQSGAGKSTLMRCLSTLEKPSSGDIYIGSQQLSSLKKEALRVFRKKIGMIFQHFNLLSSRNVQGNIALPMELSGKSKQEIEERVDELLDCVGLKHKKDAYPSELSGGEKQRVGIARALALGPDLLFCDEATSALDPRMTKEILTLLKDLNKKLGLTIILITHQMEVIREICHKVAVIDQGEIVDIGTVSDLFSHPKHPLTKQLLQNTPHELPVDILKNALPGTLFLRLQFLGNSAKEPIITQLIRHFDISVNILLGWVDALAETNMGTLTVEISGSEENKNKALVFLKEQAIEWEILNYDIR